MQLKAKSIVQKSTQANNLLAQVLLSHGNDFIDYEYYLCDLNGQSYLLMGTTNKYFKYGNSLHIRGTIDAA